MFSTQKINGSAVLSFSFLVFTFLFISNAFSGPIPPADFKITATAGGVSPWSSGSRVEIDAQGHGIYYTFSADDSGNGGFKKADEFTIDPISLKAIYGAVAQSNFFNLNKEYIKKDVLDGSYAEITVSLHGKTYTVHTQNIEVQAFDDINIAINLATPKNDKIQYNAIL